MTACHVKGMWLVIHKTGHVRTYIESPLRNPSCSGKAVYILRVCVFSLSYPECNAHAPYCHMWPVWLDHIFPLYHINQTIFRKRLLNINCVLLLSLQLFPKTFFIPRRIQRDVTNVHRSSCKVPVFHFRHQRNLEFSRHIFEKILKY
jgi:hypothetical protein